MKKILSLLLIMTMVFSLAACGGEEEPKTEEENNDAIQVDEGLINVDITLPASMFEDQTEQEIIAEAEENDIKCVVNEDGSVVYTMTKKQQKEMLADMKEELDVTIAEAVAGENGVSSFDAITYNDNLSRFDVIINENYGGFDALIGLGLLVSGAYYQMFDGVALDDIDCYISYIDAATGEEVEHVSYEDLMESAS